MSVWRKLWGYLTLKKDKDAKGNINLKLMHGINKISILMFLGALIYLVYKFMTQ